MSVLYTDPRDASYHRWVEEDGARDVWYTGYTDIRAYRKMHLPAALVAFLDRWTEKMAEYMKDYREEYPVKLAKIEFVYGDEVYRIYPETVGAVYMTDFMSDKPYAVAWDSLFEAYEKEIREDMKGLLGVKHARYYGYLD